MYVLGPNFGALVPIIALVCTFLVAMRLLKLAQLKAERKHDAAFQQQLSELHAEIESRDRAIARLEDRVRVLERIVTDDSWKLRHEIDRLRA